MFGAESDTLPAMLKNADVILTARLDGLMVGVSLAITDSAYCSYLSDLTVAGKYQGQGIGEELSSARTRRLGWSLGFWPRPQEVLQKSLPSAEKGLF